MGGTMPYLRFRGRNGLTWRPTEHPDPYPPASECEGRVLNTYLILGDLNRFERDVMGVGHGGDSLAQEYADIAETDVETVRRVLRAVFEGVPGQWPNMQPITENAPR